MSIAPEWMRRSRVFVRTPGGRNKDGVDITDQLGGGGPSTLTPCPQCFALCSDPAQVTLHVAALHTNALANHPHGPVAAEE